MPELLNYTPFPNFRYYSSDNFGRLFGVLIVKGTFRISRSGRLLVAEEQAPMVFTDTCYGEVNKTSLWHPSDLVPNKPKTDVIVNAIACAPGNIPSESWISGIQIIDNTGKYILEQKLRITGPRRWIPHWKRNLSDKEKLEWRKHRKYFDRWELSKSDPVAELPIRYEYAYGGLLHRGLDDKGVEIIDDRHDNPIGCGWIDAEWTDHTYPQTAPSIEAASDPILDPYKTYKPQGLGAIPCAWEPRLPLAGTYDEHWKTNIWPNWPNDYQFSYHNSAHPSLICNNYLTGDETVHLINLMKNIERLSFKLPMGRPVVRLEDSAGTPTLADMNMDTIIFDFPDGSKEDGRIYISWRLNFEPDVYISATIMSKQGRTT